MIFSIFRFRSWLTKQRVNHSPYGSTRVLECLINTAANFFGRALV